MNSEFKYKLLNYVFHNLFKKKSYREIGLLEFINKNDYFLSDKFCDVYKEYQKFCLYKISKRLKINLVKTDIDKYQEINRM